MFLMIPLSWLLFAIEDMGQLWIYVGRLFPFLGQTESIVFAGDFMKYIGIYGLPLLVAGICSTYLPKNIYTKNIEVAKIEDDNFLPADYNIRNYCYSIANDKLYMRVDNQMIQQKVAKTNFDKVKKLFDKIIVTLI